MTTDNQHHGGLLHGGLPSDLGTLRTVMAADRTLMAWVRTALSMISFGFTIYKFLETAASGGQLQQHPESPQRVGLFLCGMGVMSLALGVISYWATLKELQRTDEFRLGRPSLLIAAIMAVGGTMMFIAIAKRLV